MIVSARGFEQLYGNPIRNLIAHTATISQVIDLAGLPVFENTTVRTIIMIYTPVKKELSTFHYLSPPALDEFRLIRNGKDLEDIFARKAISLSLDSLTIDGWNFVGVNIQMLIKQIQTKTVPLTTYINGKPYFGIKTGFNQAYIIDQQIRDQLIETDSKNAEIIKPLVGGRDVRRYSLNFSNKYLLWTYVGVPISRYPFIQSHLKNYQTELQKRWDKGNYWWELRTCDYYDKIQEPKIIYPDIATSCQFYLDTEGYFGSNTTYFIPSNDAYLLGILNSKVALFYFIQVCAGLEGSGTVYLRFFGQYLENFPVRMVNNSDSADVKLHDQIVALADRMLILHRQLAAASTPPEVTRPAAPDRDGRPPDRPAGLRAVRADAGRDQDCRRSELEPYSYLNARMISILAAWRAGSSAASTPNSRPTAVAASKPAYGKIYSIGKPATLKPNTIT